MPSEKQPFYDPIPPTYDEALASSSRSQVFWRQSSDDPEPESQSLLRNPHASASSNSRSRSGNYHAPTVETDDEDSLFGGDSSGDDDDDDEENQVRREMQEMEVEEPHQPRGSLFGKRMPFSLSLPKWRWTWRPRMPRISIPRIRIPSSRNQDTQEETSDPADTETEAAAPRAQFVSKVGGLLMFIYLVRVLAIFAIIGFVYLLFTSNLFGAIEGPLGGGVRFNPEDLRVHVQTSIDPQRMADDIKLFSSYAHIAGTEGDYATAMDIETMFVRAKLDDIMVDEYYVYLNYPTKDGRAVEILDEKGEDAIWTAKLEEDNVNSETAGHPTYAFHGHSKAGDVKGPLIYANYGSREDFQKLKDQGIKTEGAIALVKYYGSQGDRALKVKAAELAGFAGCLIYSDPADDGFLRGEVAPNGRWMPADGVQRGAVSLMSWVVGDVLTPGFESKKGRPRLEVNETSGLVKIPSLPLAWRDAQTLLQHIKDHGQKVPKEWVGGVPDVEWWTGDASSPIVRLKNEQDEVEQQPIWNVYGKIVGMEQTAKSIIIGNHRDAWSYGAVDPHTGTAIMMEVVRIFGDLVERGWRPLRTIEFMSWDAEEYNLIGSTEFVENNIDALRENAYAYINLDTVIEGNKFRAAGSPPIQKALLHALDRVVDPNKNATLRELWDEEKSDLEGLGAGSDYVAFQDIAGTTCLDLRFEGDGHPYHSSYDNFDLVDQVLDPGFTYHVLMAQVVGLLLLDLSDRAILPFDMVQYPIRMKGWVQELEKWAAEKNKDLDFQEMRDAVDMIGGNANKFVSWESEWDRVVMSSGGWESAEVEAARIKYNDRMAQFETALLDLELGGGIPNRTQFKHVVFGPQLWSGYDEAFFPAIRDTIDAGLWDEAKRFINKTAAIMRQAARVLDLDV